MCGVIGVVSLSRKTNVASSAIHGLKDLIHRGQEGCGMSMSVGLADEARRIIVKKTPKTPFDLYPLVDGIMSPAAVGHSRYSTTGGNSDKNLQPILEPNYERSAVAHNGNLVNAIWLRSYLESLGVRLEPYGTSDTALIVAYIHSAGERIIENIESAMVNEHFLGSYSLGFVTRSKAGFARDPWGIRPLSLGWIDEDTLVCASETCAFRQIGATYERDVMPGELIIVRDGKMESRQVVEPKEENFCIFEAIYFARPDSVLYGSEVAYLRSRLGQELAREFKLRYPEVKIDVIGGVPDSGLPGAEGFGIAYSDKNLNRVLFLKHGPRTFIEPDEEVRRRSVDEKLSVIKSNVDGKSVLVVDDSIVRGNTSRKIVAKLRRAGAKEVHFAVTAPPYKWPCHYGIDTPEKDTLIANTMTLEEERVFLNVNTLTYLSVEGMEKAIPFSCKCCKACFTGNYSIPITEDFSKGRLE